MIVCITNTIIINGYLYNNWHIHNYISGSLLALLPRGSPEGVFILTLPNTNVQMLR